MASLRDCARYVREEAADGIAWIAVWKVGRSWNVDTVWPEDLEYDQGVMVLEADDLERLREIMRADADAIKACHDADFWDEDMTWEEDRLFRGRCSAGCAGPGRCSPVAVRRLPPAYLRLGFEGGGLNADVGNHGGGGPQSEGPGEVLR